MMEDTKEEYDELREEYYATLTEKRWLSIAKAIDKKCVVDFKKYPPMKPKTTGNVALKKYDLAEIRKYIDWNPFFMVYCLKGKYPNKNYPKIFNDKTVGEEAKKIYDEANKMLDWLIKEDKIEAHAVYGIWPAYSTGEDIKVDGPNGEQTFYGLRQQLDIDDACYRSLSDYIAPKGKGDHLGGFAVTCGVGVEELKEKYAKNNEIDQSILLDAVADRLTEAFAELIHLKMRKETWGYAPDEALTLDELLKCKYDGIRPAPGYPSQPDHREKDTLYSWLQVDDLSAGRISMTESKMTLPAASVTALVFAHPDAKYFAVGQVNKDQAQTYTDRRKVPLAETEKWLGYSVLGYDP